jgi:hypothetical protein
MNGFDDFDTQVSAEEYYDRDERGIEEDRDWAEDREQYGYGDEWQSQYDDDPSPYDGTYSEE